MLARLGIRGKLVLLLVVPLAGVLFAMVGLIGGQVRGAREAAITANAALGARAVSELLQSLQQERLLAMAYLSTSDIDRAAVVAQEETTVDVAERLGSDPDAAVAITRSAGPLSSLNSLRARVLSRTVDPVTAYAAYGQADAALIDALRLGDPVGADITGLRRLGALDALIRSSEEASGAGAVLVVTAADRQVSRLPLTDAITADEQHLRRFRELATPGQITLVDTIEFQESGQRLRRLVGPLIEQDSGAMPALPDVLSVAITYTGLRHVAQDRVAREIASDAQSRATRARLTALGVSGGAALLFLGMVGLAVTVSRSISSPLRRLTRAAALMADVARAELVRVSDAESPEPAPPRLAAIDIDARDEVGELAAALNRVQATAAMLLERQVVARRNVSVMFANIARRTQNLVGRQLALIDDIERNARTPELLARLYRLDHVATRLRRSADSLLVVSGTIDQTLSGAPVPLVTVIRSATAEIEGFQTVRIGEICDVAVSAAVVTDLRLLVAELLENATTFSPPGSPVEVTAARHHGCLIRIVDHGLGLSQTRMDEENRRLVDRERLDVAPTTVLGLFVVGRLARRHGLSVHLERSPVRGVTACVTIPVALLSVSTPGAAAVVATGTAPAAPGAALARLPHLSTVEDILGRIPFDRPAGPFAWFRPVERAVPAATGESTNGGTSMPAFAAVTADKADGAGLTRRVPGTHLSDDVLMSSAEEPTVRVERDPEAERVALNDFLAGLARGAEAGSTTHPDHRSLPERQP
jgi:signal transduction histidine kinase